MAVIGQTDECQKEVWIPPEALELRLITFITRRVAVIKIGPKGGLPRIRGATGVPIPLLFVRVIRPEGQWLKRALTLQAHFSHRAKISIAGSMCQTCLVHDLKH